MNIQTSPMDRERITTPAKIEKAPTTRKGLSKKLYPKYSAIPENYHGSFNKIPSEKEIIDSYWSCLQWFKERELFHQETATWYFNQMRLMELKAEKQLDLADVAHDNYSHYLDLIGIATLKRFERGGMNHVA